MPRSRKKLIWPILAILPLLSLAKVKEDPTIDAPPQLQNLKADIENSSASVQCKFGSIPDTIDCQVTLTQITRPPKEKMLKALEDTKRFFDQAKPDDFQRERSRFCKQAAQHTERFPRGLASASEYARQKNHALQRACTSPQADDLKMAMLTDIKLNASVCQSSANTFPITFKKEKESTYIAKPSPYGPCNIVTIWVLERELTSDSSWKFSVTNVSALTEGALCENVILNRPVVYSSKNPQELSISCEYIRFGRTE